MTQAEYKAAFNDAIRTHRLAGRKFNYHDLLADIELEEIAKERHAKNGNGSEPERKICWCDEGIVNGRRVPIHTPADCEYTARRSALVYEAAKIVTQQVGEAKGASALGYKWTAEFVKVMNRLAYNTGLLK